MNTCATAKEWTNILAREDDKSQNPRPIWETYTHLKCPIIGVCLNLENHKRILKTTGHEIKRFGYYELHRRIISYLNDENRVSRKVARFLDHKYRAELSALRNLDEKDFMAAWQERFNTGRMDGALYVASTKRNLSEEALSEIFGDVHMAGHANLSELMKTRQDFQLQREAHQKTARLFKHEKRTSGVLRGENVALKSNLSELRILLKRDKGAVHPDSGNRVIEKLETENLALKERLRQMERRMTQQEDQLQRLEREKRGLQIECFDLKSTSQGFENEINGLIVQISSLFEPAEGCDNKCPKYQLCSKRILIVGGITKIKHLYRNLIESSGGMFEYHDGYMKGGKKRLEAQVGRCDLVICPVNCNSHVACNKVKDLCKKFNKPVKMLSCASLSAISGALATT